MPIQIFRNPFRTLAAGFTTDDPATLGLNAPLIKVGNTWRYEKPPDILVPQLNAALANLAAMTIYTVTAGRLAALYACGFTSNVANNVQFRYNGVILIYDLAAINTPFPVSFPSPWISPTSGGVFDIFNNSGGAIFVSGYVLLAEYLP